MDTSLSFMEVKVYLFIDILKKRVLPNLLEMYNVTNSIYWCTKRVVATCLKRTILQIILLVLFTKITVANLLETHSLTDFAIGAWIALLQTCLKCIMLRINVLVHDEHCCKLA